MIMILLPSIMIVIPTFFQLILTVRRIRGKTTIPIWKTAVSSFVFGLLITIAATLVSIQGFNIPENVNNPNCATGAIVFLYLGFFITITAQPLIGIIGGLIYKNNKRFK